LVPLKALVGGLSGGLDINWPLISKLSEISRDLSPSQARNPIFDNLSELTSILVRVIFSGKLTSLTLSKPSKRLI
jgi:hypothetical protein